MGNSNFESDEFAVQVIAKGSYIDGVVGDNGELFLIEATTIRMNHVALNEWILSSILNCRGTYETDEEWEAYKVRKKAWRKEVETKIINSLGIEGKGACITQAQSEVFTVVHISEITPREEKS